MEISHIVEVNGHSQTNKEDRCEGERFWYRFSPGSKLKMPVSCSRCFAQNPQGAVACHACGLALGGVPRPAVSFRAVRADGGPEAVMPMTGDLFSCGKKGDLALPDDPFVADAQARFFFSGGKLAVEDIGGGNGVFCRLRQDRELKLGGELRIGRQRLLLEPIPKAAPAADGALAWGSPDRGARFRLVQLLEGGLKGAGFLLREGDNHLGREVGDITFPADGFISGKHAVIHVSQERLLLRDLGSSNGTFLRLAAPSYVAGGDQFLIGRQLLRVEIATV